MGTCLFRKHVLCMFSVSCRRGKPRVFISRGMYTFVLGARDRFQLQIRRFRTLTKIDTLRESGIPHLGVILNAQDKPITHAVTKITFFEIVRRMVTYLYTSMISVSPRLLISGVESVPFEGLGQLSYGELVELLSGHFINLDCPIESR